MIKNILFDFGGVLFDLDFKKTFDAFEALGFQNFEEMFSQFNANALFQQLETGKITPSAFYDSIKAIAPKPVETVEIRDAWNALLLGYRESSLAFLGELKKNYNLYLLSNTNAIHLDYFSNLLKIQTGYHSLDEFFNATYYSHLIGYRKPNAEAFEYVLNNSKIIAEETVFIDDTYVNLPNAEKLGFKTRLLAPGELIENIDYGKFED